MTTTIIFCLFLTTHFLLPSKFITRPLPSLLFHNLISCIKNLPFSISSPVSTLTTPLKSSSCSSLSIHSRWRGGSAKPFLMRPPITRWRHVQSHVHARSKPWPRPIVLQSKPCKSTSTFSMLSYPVWLPSGSARTRLLPHYSYCLQRFERTF